MNNMNNFYDKENIKGIMSLRKPQSESLAILSNILNNIELDKNIDLNRTIEIIHKLYPICTDFERDFVSLTFALATGVGKTRLMGAFITYLFTNYGYNNYFVVAPNTTIYEKLKKDLGEIQSEKYVFKGLNEIIKPKIITGDDYKNKQISYLASNVNIFVYNISKFDKDNANMKKLHENIGDSFFSYLSKLDNLVMLMDESHHYRAEKGFLALNELKPILGLEFTATPYVKVNNKQVQFKNVVYDYPLAMAIADGYTRTPYAITRKNLSDYKFGDEQIDKLMIGDGINNHERIKNKLFAYSKNNNKKFVKPFVLIVCKDTEHAEKVKSYISSKDFKDGKYIDKIVIVHSKQTKTESDANIEELLKVEKYDNPIEIVIHVDKLKEGWDVNNLYTIIPLRTATSKILREQMIGRGLRLPFGERTGESDIDGVYLTAHDKFDEIIEEAVKGDSIFRLDHIINIDGEDGTEFFTETPLNIYLDLDNINKKFYENNGIKETIETNQILLELTSGIKEDVENRIIENEYKPLDIDNIYRIATEKCDKIRENEDYSRVIENSQLPVFEYLKERIDETQKQVFDSFIPIPRITTRYIKPTEYIYNDFELDYKQYDYKVIENEVLVKNIVDNEDTVVIKGDYIDFEAYNPKKVIIELLIKYPEIDYEKCKHLLSKLLDGLFFYLRHKLSADDNGIKNIVMMNKIDIANKIYNEIVSHITYKDGIFDKEIVGLNTHNMKSNYNYKYVCPLQKDYKNLDSKNSVDIKSVLFKDIKKSVFAEAKFDSGPEWLFAKMLDIDDSVVKWLRPAPKEFNITYAGNKNYEPDFVVETRNMYYLVEVKRSDEILDENVIKKKDEAALYCELASKYCLSKNMKEWKYLFIRDNQISNANMLDYYINNCEAKK